MSITTEISRIQADRNTIRTKLVELGLATSTDKLDALAAAVEGLVNQGAVSVEILEGNTYTIPAGYHNGSGVVKAMTDAAGDALRYKTQAKTVTPTKSQQSVTPNSGYYALESVTVNAIPDAYQDVTDVTATAETVLTGKVFVDVDGTVVVGTMPNNGAVDATLSVTDPFYTVPKGYHNGSGKVKIVFDEKSVTPTKSYQTVVPDTGKVLGAVEVAPIPKAYQDVTGVTATPETVLAGSKFVNAEGEVKSGAVVIREAATYPLDGLTTTSFTVPAGFHGGNTSVALTDDIENALAAI